MCFKFLIIILFFCFAIPACAEDADDFTAIYIPTGQGFDFGKGSVVAVDKGDINITPYGIEATSIDVEIATLGKGFVEDIKALPDRKDLKWLDLQDYVLDMRYAARCRSGRYAAFELIDVKMLNDEITGIEIRYKILPK